MTRLAAFILALFGSAAAAQDKVYSESELSYSVRDAGGARLDGARFLAAGAYDVGAFGWSATALSTWTAQEGADLGINAIAVELFYDLGPRVALHTAYAFLDVARDQSDLAEIGATYDAGGFWLTVFAGTGADDLGLADRYAGASGGIDLGQGTQAAVGYYTTDRDGFDDVLTLSVLHRSGPLEIEMDLIRSAGDTVVVSETTYSLSSRTDLYFGFDHATTDAGDAMGVAVGAGYEVAPGLHLFGTISRDAVDGAADVDGVTLGLTYNTGKRTLREDGSFQRVLEPMIDGRAGAFAF